MSEFDKLEGDAEQYAKDHPQQVHEAEQDAEHAAESKLGSGAEQGQAGQGPQGQDQREQNGCSARSWSADGDHEWTRWRGRDR